jgi:hypothetical protein
VGLRGRRTRLANGPDAMARAPPSGRPGLSDLRQKPPPTDWACV